jgi:hypothetical protein
LFTGLRHDINKFFEDIEFWYKHDRKLFIFKHVFRYSTLPNYYVGFGKNSWAVTLLVV